MKTWIFWADFRKIIQISNSLKIRPVGIELFHADGQTDITQVIVCFPQFRERAYKAGRNAPKEMMKLQVWQAAGAFYMHTASWGEWGR